MNYRVSLVAILLAVAACGGGSGAGGNPPAPPDPPPPPTSCSGNHLINVIAATDNGQSSAGNGPELAVDDDLDPASRWASPGDAMTITFDLGVRYLVREVGIAWFEGDQRVASFSVHTSEDGTNFEPLLTNQQSSGTTRSFERYDTPDTPAQYIRIEAFGNSLNTDNSIVEGTAFGCTLDTPTAVFENGNATPASFGLDPNQPPGSNFELLSWKLNTPADLDGNGISDTASETDLDNGFADGFFFTGPAGGMVFYSTIGGATTSAG
ncbi:MAG: discoidin domain-containing protein, partial [Pseudomonadota bacterium]